MELWPRDDKSARLKHSGIAAAAILFFATLMIGGYLESHPPIMTLPSIAKPASFACFFILFIILIALGLKQLSEADHHKSFKYGLAFWGFFISVWLLWLGIKLVNIKADDSLPHHVQVIVLGKHKTVGKGGSSEYLDVVYTDNETKKYRFRVTSSVYSNSKVKDKYNLWLKRGYFNQPWVLSYKKVENSE